MEEYVPFIKKYNIGLEGSSCWWWRLDNETGVWESKGYAADTIEESLELLKGFIERKEEVPIASD